MTRRHKRLNFEPQWEGAIAGWTVTYAKHNYWRVAALMDFEDLIQDGYVKFLQCCYRYPSVMEAAHFMSLYQQAFRNHIHTLSTKQSRMGERVETVRTEDGEDDFPFDNLVGEITSAGDLAVLVEQMPKEARELVIAMANDDEGRFRTDRWKMETKRGLIVRETTNEMWCRIMGYDPEEVDLPGVLRAFLRDA